MDYTTFISSRLTQKNVNEQADRDKKANMTLDNTIHVDSIKRELENEA